MLLKADENSHLICKYRRLKAFGEERWQDIGI